MCPSLKGKRSGLSDVKAWRSENRERSGGAIKRSPVSRVFQALLRVSSMSGAILGRRRRINVYGVNGHCVLADVPMRFSPSGLDAGAEGWSACNALLMPRRPLLALHPLQSSLDRSSCANRLPPSHIVVIAL
jgi:hypothetical protein